MLCSKAFTGVQHWGICPSCLPSTALPGCHHSLLARALATLLALLALDRLLLGVELSAPIHEGRARRALNREGQHHPHRYEIIISLLLAPGHQLRIEIRRDVLVEDLALTLDWHTQQRCVRKREREREREVMRSVRAGAWRVAGRKE